MIRILTISLLCCLVLPLCAQRPSFEVSLRGGSFFYDSKTSTSSLVSFSRLAYQDSLVILQTRNYDRITSTDFYPRHQFSLTGICVLPIMRNLKVRTGLGLKRRQYRHASSTYITNLVVVKADTVVGSVSSPSITICDFTESHVSSNYDESTHLSLIHLMIPLSIDFASAASRFSLGIEGSFETPVYSSVRTNQLMLKTYVENNLTHCVIDLVQVNSTSGDGLNNAIVSVDVHVGYRILKELTFEIGAGRTFSSLHDTGQQDYRPVNVFAGITYAFPGKGIIEASE